MYGLIGVALIWFFGAKLFFNEDTGIGAVAALGFFGIIAGIVLGEWFNGWMEKQRKNKEYARQEAKPDITAPKTAQEKEEAKLLDNLIKNDLGHVGYAKRCSHNSDIEIAQSLPLSDGRISAFIEPEYHVFIQIELFTEEDHRRFSQLGQYYQAGLLTDGRLIEFKTILCINHLHPSVLIGSGGRVEIEKKQALIDAWKARYGTVSIVDGMLEQYAEIMEIGVDAWKEKQAE